MARGLKLWLAVVVAGSAALFGLIRLYSNSLGRMFSGTPRDSLSMVHDSLSREAARTATAVQRIRWSRAMGDGADTLVVLGPDIPAIPAFRAVADTALAALEPDAPVAVAVLSRGWQRPYDGSRYATYLESRGIDYLLPAGGPCQVAVFVPGGPTTPSTLGRDFDADRLLGPCGWVARYGPPSDSVRAWLRRGGGRFARSLTPSTPTGSGSDVASGRDALSGNRLSGLGTLCRRGVAQACVEVFRYGEEQFWGNDADVPADLILFDMDVMSRDPFGGAGAHLLADIEAEIGRDRFAALWRADQPVDAAVSEALGRPVGPWLADWAETRIPAPRQGGVRLVDVLLTLLTVLVLAGIALFTGAKGRPVTGL